MPHPASDAGSGSGTGGSGAASFVSGTRLRINYVTGEDGSRAPFGGFHDAKLGVDCVFEQTADAGLRCTPLTGGSYAPSELVSGMLAPE